ncbi:MAG: DNA alkylation repair protein [Gammaproteobacteria bacterium]|nr:DNA alkylation repair protein [Gammaproteobacteria bacterium]
MAEPLKNHFGVDVPKKIAAMISAVYPRFPTEAFITDALTGYQALELMPRGWHIAHVLRRHLPQDYAKAAEILMASLGAKLTQTDNNGMAPFLYMPHAFFVAEYGLDHFEISMQAQYELTQRFTAEFSIRPYLMQHQAKTLARLREWTKDENASVRRLVSEGTRPRLPWAPRLREFQRDPTPVLALLECLKDDPALYVRRSVANNLNDIGKDHPDILVKTAKSWMQDADENRRWIVRHALRSAVKNADAAALQILGFSKSKTLLTQNAKIKPKRAAIGEAVVISFEIQNKSTKPQSALVDFCIHFVKANGKTSAKVFKLKKLVLAPGEICALSKKISLKEMTTRKHYAGLHKVNLLINGASSSLGEFYLRI